MKNLKLKGEFVLDEIVKLYENESSGVKLHKELKLALSKEILILVGFVIVGILLKNYSLIKVVYVLISLVFIVLWNFLTLNNIIKKIDNCEEYKFKNILDNFSRIVNKFRKEDINLLRKILIKNNLYKNEILDEMIEFYKQGIDCNRLNLKETVWKILEIFISSILGILGVYVAIYSSFDLEFYDLVLGVLRILEKSIVIYIIVVILYIIYRLKHYSIKDCYIYPEIYKMLLEIKIFKLKKSKSNKI